ncbi:S1C family serine protease [Halobacillus yeomjeoni]|uniref:Trypsin-like peptidase domain-containing protein n=1 Tax=Halobacillus yeomjeoni TaxID=311194 RepID=A0A931HS26_9BACI|nr:serine protease [Halobacillus yeomjeoni]MBH0228639.1 trypsin-like peptidase domain-containing protein [Halobacillus yeomjeoni]
MFEHENDKKDIIDEDLYEEIDDEELLEIIEEEKRKAWEKDRMDKEKRSTKRPFPKWIFWLIAIMMVTNVIAVLPNTFSIPVVDFLKTSAELSTDDEIKRYKDAVVVVEAGQSRGTGFSISEDGTILTNHHVIEGKKRIAVAFPDEGLFEAEVVHQFPEVDLAVLKASGDSFPYLKLANKTHFEENEHISFIGNPLRFTGIANQGEIIGYKQLNSWNQPVLMLKAPIYRGNSGSPVINEEGRVIGVVFATLRDEVEGKVGLAVPIDYYYEKVGN